jgi:hypothetical protein
MIKYARKINNLAVDVITGDPYDFFHPNIAAQFYAVNDDVENGWVYDPVLDVWSEPIRVAKSADALINFTYPTAAAKSTDITVDVAVVNSIENSLVPVSETYYVPLMNIITGTMDQMLVIPVVDGIGQVVFRVASAGVVGITVDLIRPRPTAKFSSLPDIAIY